MILFVALLAFHRFEILPIENRLAEIEKTVKGRLGAAIVTPSVSYYSKKNERFSLQSVMKLMVAMAALDQVDQGRWKLEEKFVFKRSDLSLFFQPIADQLGKKDQMSVTLEQCIELTVTESCSASGDFLIRQMGGTSVVNAFLKKNQIDELSVDREERDLQTNILGISWKAEYIDEKKLQADIDRIPESQLDLSYQRYQKDPRDTTTPAAMAKLLQKLVTGKLLSAESTKYLLGVMEQTKTGADRLPAGIANGWKLGHKTGTSSSHKGVAAATNDVGFVRNSKGDWIVIVALVGDSRAEAKIRAEAIRDVAKLAFSARL